jgi:hypothetical protein
MARKLTLEVRKLEGFRKERIQVQRVLGYELVDVPYRRTVETFGLRSPREAEREQDRNDGSVQQKERQQHEADPIRNATLPLAADRCRPPQGAARRRT